MSDNRSLIAHIKTDPNAPYHAAIGAIASLAGLILLGGLGAVFAPLLAGIGIECVQRIQRGHFQGRESAMDILTTWLWPLIIFRGVDDAGG